MRRALTAEPFEDALPIREFFAWPGKRNYEGLWWSSVRTDASPERRDRLAVRGVHWTRWAGGARPYLAGWIRMDRYAPSPDVARHLIEAVHASHVLEGRCRRAARSSGVQKDLVQANALNMLFTGRLSVDLRQPLTMASEVGAVVAVGGPGRSSGAPLSPLPRST